MAFCQSPELQKALSKKSDSGESSQSAKLPANLPNISKPVQIPQTSSTNSSQTSYGAKYFTKPNFQNIIPLEKGISFKTPFECAQRYFGNYLYVPTDPAKTPEFCQTILEVTRSVTLIHHYKFPNQQTPSYSLAKIHKVLPPSEWPNENLTKPISFTYQSAQNEQSKITFNYWDYQQAWFNAFLIQNPKYSHTWLIFFKECNSIASFPYWWNSWWTYFGLTDDILSGPLHETFNLFKTHFKPTTDEARFPPTANLCSKLYLPWVLCWYFDIQKQNNISFLRRYFKIRMWEKYQPKGSLTPQGMKNFLGLKQNQDKKQVEFLAQKSKMQSMIAAAKTPEEVAKILSQFAPQHEEVGTSKVPDDAESSTEDEEALPDFEVFGNSGF